MIVGIEAAHANKKQLTGVERVCFEVIENLKKIIPPSTRVVLYSNTLLGEKLGCLPSNWSARILVWPFKKLWSQIRLSWELLIRAPDVFIAPGQLLPFFCPKNTVAIVHDSAFLFFPEAYNFCGRQYLKWMNKRIIKKAKLIVTPSEFNKQELLRYYKISADKIVVIPWGYEKELYRPLTVEEKKETDKILLGHEITKPFLLAINRLEHKKNTARIVQTFNILKKNFDLQLVLVGKSGVGYEEVKKELENSPYKKDIKVLGWLEDCELPHLFSSAQVFLVPSLYEGFGLPLLNALAVGCPTVVSKGSSLTEIGGEAVISVKPENTEEIAQAVREFLTNEEKRKNCVALGLELASHYSWEKSAQLICKEVLKLPKGV